LASDTKLAAAIGALDGSTFSVKAPQEVLNTAR
jgi:hypothetical protein